MAGALDVLQANLDRAYLFARHVLGDAHRAEEAVQEACLRYLRRPPADQGERAAAAYLFRMVRGVAVDLLRGEAARARREEERMRLAETTAARPEQALADQELQRAAEQELDRLPREFREAVCLCCREGFTQREAARILGLPQTTVSDYVRRGLEMLRRTLAARGFAAAALAPAVLGEALGSLGVPRAPAALAAKVEALAAGKAAAAGGAGAGLKGGLIVKLVAGVVLAGAAAVGVALVAPGMSKRGAPLSAEAPRRFATPCTDPGARWGAPEIWAGFPKDRGYLDGPRQGAMSFTGMAPPGIFEDGGMFVYRRYDDKTERFFTCAGSAYGDLDGPFGRARFGGWGYTSGSSSESEDGKYLYFTNPNAGTIKRLNFEKRLVEPVAGNHNFGGNAVVAPAPDGVLYVLAKTVFRVTAEGKVEPRASESFPQPGGAGTRWAAYDSKNNRIYAGTRSSDGKDYPIFYYIDLAAGGKVVGLIDNRKYSGQLRKQCTTGPFAGTLLHCPGGGFHGPEDPDYRFFYVAGGDEGSFYRFDVAKSYFSKICPVEKGKPALSHFGDYEGKVNEYRKIGGNARGGTLWLNAGVSDVFISARGCAVRLPRVK